MADVSIKTRKVLTYEDREFTITQQVSSDNYFLLKGHIPALANFIVPKSGSLVHAPGLQELREQRNRAAGLVSEQAHQGLFDSKSDAPKKKGGSKRKVGLLAEGASDQVTIDVDGVQVTMMRPSSVDSCLAILMTESCLGAVINYISERGASTDSKRSYVNSGKFAKKKSAGSETAAQALSSTG